MAAPASRFHVLGVDDAPFTKRVDPTVPVVAVLMEGHDLVEAVATTSFEVDGETTGSTWPRLESPNLTPRH